MKEPTEEPTSAIPIFTSMGQAAASSGIPLAVLKNAKAGGCGEAFLNGKVNLKTFLKWYFSQLEMADYSVDWKNDKTKSEALTARIKLQEAQQSIISFDTVSDFHGRLIGDLFGDLVRIFCNELPGSLKGKDEIGIRIQCESEIEAFKKDLKNKLEDWEAKHQPKVGKEKE